MLGRAHTGQPTDFAFIRHPLPEQPLVRDGETFLALVIGGSSYRTALVTRRGLTYERDRESTGPIPKLRDTSVFFPFLASLIPPQVSVVAFNFAFAMTPSLQDGRLEGILVSGGKEHGLTDLLGKPVAASIEAYLRGQGRQVRFTVANDAICLLLSGLPTHPRTSLAAGIVGTGLNFAVFADPATAVNLESAVFTGFPQSEAGRGVDRVSQSPGRAVLEKEVSGEYLPRLFTGAAAKLGLTGADVRSAADVSDLAYAGREGSEIARALLARSAAWVAAQMVGIAEWYERPTTFVMEGSVYWHAWRYRELVEHWIGQLGCSQPIDAVKVADSALTGAIHLAL